MTPISEMTNEQLDRWIAEKRGDKGYGIYIDGYKQITGEVTGFNYDLPIYKKTPLHFTTDPRYAFELLEEMKEDMVIVEYNYDHDFTPLKMRWFVHFPNHNVKRRGIIAANEELTRAISEAYASGAEWKGGE